MLNIAAHASFHTGDFIPDFLLPFEAGVGKRGVKIGNTSRMEILSSCGLISYLTPYSLF
jgi:hypothetical protein